MGADLGEAKGCQLAGLEGSTPEKGDREGAKSDFSGGSCSSDRAKASATDAHSACKAGGNEAPGDRGAERVPGKHKHPC